MKAKRLILHLGHGKTGSTSIQRALRASRTPLRAAGVLFPDPGRHDNHQLLFPHLHGCLPDDPVQMASLADTPQAAFRNAARLYDELLAQMRKERPEVLVLSCENQFRPFPPDAIARLRGFCGELAEELQVIAYLRAPAGYYLSAVQQNLKKRPELGNISAARIRDTLEPFVAALGDAVEAHRFARDALIGGDVVTDFVTRYLGQVPVDSLSRGEAEENTSVSPEAMALLQEIFRGARALPGRYDRDRKAFRKIVVAQDTEVPERTRPVLFDPVRAALEARVTDLDWTRDVLGVTFPEMGPVEMDRERAEAIYAELRDVSDICAVDADRKEALWETSLKAAKPGLLGRLLGR